MNWYRNRRDLEVPYGDGKNTRWQKPPGIFLIPANFFRRRSPIKFSRIFWKGMGCAHSHYMLKGIYFEKLFIHMINIFNPIIVFWIKSMPFLMFLML